jgi:hypothetical protein
VGGDCGGALAANGCRLDSVDDATSRRELRESREAATGEHESVLEEATSGRWMNAALGVGAGVGFGSQFGMRMPEFLRAGFYFFNSITGPRQSVQGMTCTQSHTFRLLLFIRTHTCMIDILIRIRIIKIYINSKLIPYL